MHSGNEFHDFFSKIEVLTKRPGYCFEDLIHICNFLDLSMRFNLGFSFLLFADVGFFFIGFLNNLQERFNKECHNRNIGLSENFLTDAKSEHKGVVSMIKVLLIQSS